MPEQKNFVFIDDRPWPYHVRLMDSGQWWLYYWVKATKTFRTMRELTPEEVDHFREFALPEEQAKLYMGEIPL